MRTGPCLTSFEDLILHKCKLFNCLEKAHLYLHLNMTDRVKEHEACAKTMQVEYDRAYSSPRVAKGGLDHRLRSTPTIF